MNQASFYCTVIFCTALVRIAISDDVNPRINVICNGTTTSNITLEYCLVDPILCFRSNCTVKFDSGIHRVFPLNYTAMCVIENVSNLSLEGKNGTVIDCAKRASFGFINVSVLKVTDIHFINCGVNITEKIPKLINKTVFLPLTLKPDQKIGIFLLNVVHLFLNNVEIYNSLGYGLLGINLLGTSIIENCLFSRSNYETIQAFTNNTLDCYDSRNLGKCNGGNGFFIYADLQMNDVMQHQIIDANLTLSRVNASEGVNLVNSLSGQFASYNPASTQNLVSGGGISLLLLQVNFTVNFVFKDSFCAGNFGFTGANIYINVFYFVLNSSISVDHVEIVFGNHLLNGELVTISRESYGGGMYYEYGNYFKEGVPAPGLKHDFNLGYKINFSNLDFLFNEALSGGGLYVKFHLTPISTNQISHILNIDQCLFASNRAFFGAGIHINELQYKQVQKVQEVQNVFLCSISNTLFEYHHHSNVFPVKFNAAIESTIFLNEIQSYFKMKNVTVVKSYGCTGILLINSIVICDGMTISDNVNFGNGGGAIIIGQSYFVLSPNSVFLIQNNTGITKGGGVYIPTITSYDFQPLCFFQVLPRSKVSPRITDINDYNASIMILNNKAEIGYDIYGGDLEKCYLLFWDVQTTKAYSTFINTTDDSEKSSKISSYAETICFCVDEKENCNMLNINVSVYPGQSFSTCVVPIGQLNGTTESDSLTIGYSKTHNHDFKVNISDVSIHLKPRCGKLNLKMSTKFNPQTTTKRIFFYLFVNGMLDRFYWKYVYVYIKPCPPFFYYSNVSQVCECVRILKEYCTNYNGLVQRPSASYIGYLNNCTHVYHYCPIDQCNSSVLNITASEQDKQCVNNRKGIMCAECKDGYSRVIGSNACLKCSNINLLVIIIFALMGIVLVWFLSFFNLTVSNGMINGIIFYANIVKVNRDILYPGISDHTFLSLVIAWINLDFGFEICLFNGMTEFHKTLLQLTFPVYLWILSMLAIYLTRHYRIMGKILGKHSTPALATVILLSFTKLLNIVTRIFSPIRILRQCGDGDIKYDLAWFSDASLSFKNHDHIVLVIIAFFMTLFCILPYTLLLVSSPFLHRFNQYSLLKWVARLKPFIDAYEGPYNGSKRFWTGFLLVVRICLMFAFALNIYGYNQFQLFIIAITSIVLIFLTIRGKGIYHSKALNHLESLSIFNLAAYSVVVQYLITVNEKKGLNADKYVSYASLSVLGVLVILVVLVRVLIVILGKCGIVEEENIKPWIVHLLRLRKLSRNLRFVPSSRNSTNGPRSMMDYETLSGTNDYCEDSSEDEDLWKRSVHEYREPLLEDLEN